MLIKLNEDNFKKETEKGLKLIEFYTSWCGYCKKQEPELKEMDKIWIGQVEADENKKIASEYNISAYPTFLILKNGNEVDRFSGFREKEYIMSIIMKHL